MKTIEFNKEILEIKKSKFIGLVYNVNTVDVVKEILYKIKDEYPKATHYTYAYRLDNIERSTDDKEPSGTAGVPILSVLQKNDINNCLLIVIRYFGGIKLGVGPLTRAYSKCASMVIDNAIKKDLIKGVELCITFDYNKEKEINNILRNSKIVNKEYNESITYNVLVTEEIFNHLNSIDCNIEKLKDVYIEKDINL